MSAIVGAIPLQNMTDLMIKPRIFCDPMSFDKNLCGSQKGEKTAPVLINSYGV
jgi:hypothetical protein